MDAIEQDVPAVLFFDVDGTIIWHPVGTSADDTVAHAVPTPAVTEAFHRLRDRGHLAFICTGRPLCLVSQALLDLRPAGLVTSAGACLVIDGKVVAEEPIPLEIFEDAVRRLVDAGVEVLLEGTEGCVALIPGGGTYEGIPGVPTAHNLDDVRRLSNMRFCKFSYQDSQLPALQTIKDALSRHFAFFDLGLGVGEACRIGQDKATGVRRVLEYLGRDERRTFGFGDSENDLPMLRSVETPVAMGNALPSVKAMASYVTTPVEEDGVPAALAHFGLI